MPTIYLDSIKDSEYEEDETGIRYARGFHSAALDCSLPADILRKAIITSPGMPQRGEAHPTIGGCVVVGYRIRFNTTANIASGAILYRTPTSSSGASSGGGWVYSDKSSLESITVSKIPVFNSPGLNLHVTYTTGKDDSGNDIQSTKPASIRLDRPLRTISASIVHDGPAPEEWKAAIATVNRVPFRGLYQGYWKVLGVDEITTNGGDSYVVSVSIQTRITEDWSTYDVATDANGPRAISDADVQTIMSPLYRLSAPAEDVGNGITRVYPYAVSDFNAVFGIS